MSSEKRLIELKEDDIMLKTEKNAKKNEWKDIGEKRHHNCPLTILQEKQLLKDYFKSSLGAIQIGKKYGLGSQALYLILRAYNLDGKKQSGSPPKYHVNKDFFKKIDTKEKAYILGLLYADGNVHGKGITLCLQERDRHILKSISKILDFNGKLHFLPKRKKHHQNQYRLFLYNQDIANDLIKLGCVPAKSLILKFPTPKQVSNKFIRHFIRGYFDGDGCIYVNFKNFYKRTRYNTSLKATISMVSTFSFLRKLKKVCKNKLGINFSLTRKIKTDKRYPNNKITSEIVLTRRESVVKFCEWIYKDSDLFLARKHKKYKDFVKELEIQSKR